MKIQKEEWIYNIVILSFLLLVFVYGIGRVYGFSMLPDEFGYWASAARLAGFDWTNVASLGSYYSFGYSLILTPVLILFQDAVSAYRVAVFINVLLLMLTFMLLQRIVKRLEPELDSGIRILLSGICVFYPPWLLYMDMTLTEILLVFSFVLVCDLVLIYLERKRISDLLMLGIATAFLYTIHMRTVGIVLSVIGIVLVSIWGRKTSRGKKIVFLLLFLVFVSVLFCFTDIVKNVVQKSVYAQANESLLSVNDYSGQWNKVRSLLNPKGLCEFIVSFLGKVFYLGMASFGLFYYGMGYLIQRVFDRNEKSERRFFFAFCMLAVIGQILVCAVYTKGYGRIDGLLYGRYDENILPIVMVMGCVGMMGMKRPGIVFICLIGTAIPMVALIHYVIEKYQLTNIHGGYFISGMSYLLSYIDFEPDNYFWKAFLFGAILCLILYGIFCMVRRDKGMGWVLLIFLGMECLLGISLSEQYTFVFNHTTYANIHLAKQISQMCEGTDRRIVSYGNQGDDNVISTIQFVLRDTKIRLISEEDIDLLTEQDLVLVSGVHGEEESLREYYEEQEAYGSFWLYYNE